MSSHWASADDIPSAPPTKMVVCVRQDLGMGPGKVAAQVSHATLGAYRATQRKPDGEALLRAWADGGEPTIVLAVDDHEQLEQCMRLAEERGLVAHRIADAGRTEVAAGTVTVGAIGPAGDPLESTCSMQAWRNHGHSCFLCEIVIRSQFHTTYEPKHKV